MPRGRRRKIEVPTDTQPQIELKDTAEDIEGRRREREERDQWFEAQCTRYGKLTQMKSGQAAEKSTERQTCLKDSFSFSTRSH